jgi:hypothetical protein
MGNLSNLYVSKSFQSLIHLGTDGTASAALTTLQDGLGNSIGIEVSTTGNVYLSGSLTASLREGYVLVGNSSGKTSEFATSSLVTNINTGSLVTTSSFNSYTASTDSSITQLNASSASQQISINALNAATSSYVTSAITASSLVTASFSGNTLTFTKGNGTTFGVVIPDVSGSTINTGSFATTGSNTFDGANNFSSSVDILGGLNLYQNGLFMGYPKNMGDPFDTNISISTPKIVGQSSSGNRLVISGDPMQQKGVTVLYGLGVTGSVVISKQQVGMSFTGGDLNVEGTFTSSLQEGYVWVGNSSGRTTTVATSSFIDTFVSGNLVTTASFNAYTQSNNQRVSSLEVNSASVNVSITNVNNATASLFTSVNNINAFTSSTQISINALNASSASQQISIDALNTNSASVNSSITQLNASSASQQVSIDNLNSFSSSQLIKDDTLASYTGSNDTKWSTLGGQSGSWITESETSSFARYDVSNPWSANQTFTNITAVSASFTYIQTLYETSSVIYSSGSNQFGDAANDIQTLYGSTRIMNELTASGLHYPTADNGVKSFMQTDGAGNLSLQYVEQVFETIRNMSGVTLLKGTPVYISGSTGDNGNAYIADASDLNKMPAVYIVGEDLTIGATGLALLGGKIEGVNTTGYPAGTIIYVAEGGGWSINRPSGSNSVVQVLGVVQKEGLGGQGVVINQLEAILPNIQTGYLWVGNGNNQPIAVATSSFEPNGDFVTTSSFNAYTASTDSSISQLNANSASVNTSITNINSFTSSQDTLNTGFLVSLSNLNASSASQQISINELNANSASVNTSITNINAFTSSANQRLTAIESVSGSWITESETGSFATTGSNVFTGDQILSDATSNTFNIQSYSGSLFLTAKGIASGSSTLTHFTSSINQVNLVFKNNAATGETVISGSNNIFSNPNATTAGFRRYVGNSNIGLGGLALPQLSSSMAWSPNVNGNIFSHTLQNSFTWRGPVSSSVSNINHNITLGSSISLGTSAVNNFEKAVSGTNFIGNAVFNGSINSSAFITPLSSSVNITGNLIFGAQINLNNISSSITYNSNVQNGFFTVNNAYSPIAGTVAAAMNARVGTNTVYGTGHGVNINGSNTATNQTKQFQYNILAGTYLSSSIGGGDNSAIIATGLIGNGLIVTGSTTPSAVTGPDAANSSQGSLFAGRFNAQDGSKSKTGETIFAVGTGTSYTNRKTGFLIDSGSNTFVEGSLNVSGSSTFTGSVGISVALSLKPNDPLPAGAIGDLAVSGSNLFFYNGAWTQVI